MRSEYSANLALAHCYPKTEMEKQIERNRAVHCEVTRLRREIAARKAAEKKWWEIWK